jgi:hypothetical protein
VPFTRGPLGNLLKNRISVGEITHKGQSYPGEHEAIIGRALFEAVQNGGRFTELPANSGAIRRRRENRRFDRKDWWRREADANRSLESQFPVAEKNREIAIFTIFSRIQKAFGAADLRSKPRLELF